MFPRMEAHQPLWAACYSVAWYLIAFRAWWPSLLDPSLAPPRAAWSALHSSPSLIFLNNGELSLPAVGQSFPPFLRGGIPQSIVFLLALCCSPGAPPGTADPGLVPGSRCRFPELRRRRALHAVGSPCHKGASPGHSHLVSIRTAELLGPRWCLAKMRWRDLPTNVMCSGLMGSWPSPTPAAPPPLETAGPGSCRAELPLGSTPRWWQSGCHKQMCHWVAQWFWEAVMSARWFHTS